MTTFTACLIGEDRTEFAIEIDALTINEARDAAEAHYPEATVDEVFDRNQREMDAYHAAQRRYDDPLFDDYSWGF